MRCSQAAIDLPGIPAQAIQMALSESNRTLRSRNILLHLPKVGLRRLFSTASLGNAFREYL
jgi:hypothetical protein